jgi:hypothetical protein
MLDDATVATFLHVLASGESASGSVTSVGNYMDVCGVSLGETTLHVTLAGLSVDLPVRVLPPAP